jgi:hypothetical protein
VAIQAANAPPQRVAAASASASSSNTPDFAQVNKSAAPTMISDHTAVCERLTAYTDSIPHHNIGDLGKSAEISSVRLLSVQKFQLQTLYETRAASREAEPYVGQNIPEKRTDESNVNIWNVAYDFPPHAEFSSRAESLRVQDSQSVIQCTGCAGVGLLRCGKCGGQGRVRCGKCGGSGQVTLYRKVQRQRNCTCDRGYRSGTNQVCSACNGTLRQLYDEDEPYPANCGNCRTSGIVTCPRCGGSGQVVCERCEGRRQLVSFLEIEQKIHPGTLKNQWEPEDVPAEAVAKIKKEDFDPLCTLIEAEFSPVSSAQAIASSTLKNLIAPMLDAPQGEKSDIRRIIKQQFDFEVAGITQVDFSYESENYTFWLVGKSWELYAASTPVGDYLKELVDRGVAHWKAGKKEKAIDLIRDCWYIAWADPNCRTIFDSLEVPKDLLKKANDKRQRMASWGSLLGVGAAFSCTTGLSLVFLLLSPMMLIGFVGLALGVLDPTMESGKTVGTLQLGASGVVTFLFGLGSAFLSKLLWTRLRKDWENLKGIKERMQNAQPAASNKSSGASAQVPGGEQQEIVFD